MGRVLALEGLAGVRAECWPLRNSALFCSSSHLSQTISEPVLVTNTGAFCLSESPNPRTDDPDRLGSQVAGREHIYLPCAFCSIHLPKVCFIQGLQSIQKKQSHHILQTMCISPAHWHRHTLAHTHTYTHNSHMCTHFFVFQVIP